MCQRAPAQVEEETSVSGNSSCGESVTAGGRTAPQDKLDYCPNADGRNIAFHDPYPCR